MIDTVEDRWRALLIGVVGGEPESREVDAESPLQMIIGVSPVGRPYFAVFVSRKPGLPDLTSAIDVIRRQRSSDGRWTLTLELQVPALTDAFISLVSELATKSAAAADESTALGIFLETLAEWQELLTARTDRLSESALRGLIAELWFGFESGAHEHPLADVARAWAGPLGGAQDFQFLAPGRQYEVKSLRPGRSTVEISSEEQLDGDNVELAVVCLDEIADPPGGITLPGLVTTIRSRLSDGTDRSEFNRRFARLFIDLNEAWYSEHAYTVQRLQIFDVSEDFPALRRSQLPKEIARASYRVDVQHLPQFVVFEMDYSHGNGGKDG